MINAVLDEVEYYLASKGEPDPWPMPNIIAAQRPICIRQFTGRTAKRAR